MALDNDPLASLVYSLLNVRSHRPSKWSGMFREYTNNMYDAFVMDDGFVVFAYHMHINLKFH